MIQIPAANATFAVGETILLRGAATDAQDGALPDSALSWEVLRHHATHTHPYVAPVTGNAASYPGPAPEDLPATTSSYLEVRLTATDSKGLTTTVTRDLQPQLASIALATQPAGLTVTLDGIGFRRRRPGHRGSDGTSSSAPRTRARGRSRRGRTAAHAPTRSTRRPAACR